MHLRYVNALDFSIFKDIENTSCKNNLGVCHFSVELTGSLAAKTEACSTFFCGAGGVSNIGRLGDEHVVW